MNSKIEYNRFTDEYFLVIPDDVVETLKLGTGNTMDWTTESYGVRIVKRQPEVHND